MKYYYVLIEVQDGEHEHIYKAVARGETESIVQNRISEEQDYNTLDKAPHEYSIASFGDDLTAANAYVSHEITKEHFDILKEYLSEV